MKLALKMNAWSLLLFIMVLKSCTPVSKKEKIRIAAAASTQYVLEALIADYESKVDVEIETIISSSGKLTAQIEHGAPIDIFISADTLYPNYLFEKGMGVEPPTIYAYGQLVLWTFGKYDLRNGLAVLKKSKIQKIAIADPKTAPYGKLSQAYLKENKIYESLKDQLVFGESIGQVNQYVTTEAADVGLTAKSVVLAPELKGKGQFVVLGDAFLAQSVLLLKRSEASKKSLGFYQFLQSSEAQRIFEEYGYVSRLQ